VRTTYSKNELLYEGKAKKIFSTEVEGILIQEFKDSLTAFNAQKKGSFDGKGNINLKITSCIFKYLTKLGIPTHFIEQLNDQDMVVEKLEMIPLEVVVRNKTAGSIATRLGLVEGLDISTPLVEFYYKKDELNDPLVTEDQIAIVLKAATASQILELKKKALEINKHLEKLFSEVGIDLIDFKIEFGVNSKNEIILADEISPDSCRLWDSKTKEKLDKDRFRRDLGKVEESYRLISDRILKRWGNN
jgi:phosphoribosylaminoimidazole-succinocarboxamide synthase